MAPSGWPAEGLMQCVEFGRWDDGDSVFTELRKQVLAADAAKLSAQVVHASLTWAFLFGFCEKRKIHKRLVMEVICQLMASEAWTEALSSEDRLREQALSLPEDVQAGLKCRSASPPCQPAPSSGPPTPASLQRNASETGSQAQERPRERINPEEDSTRLPQHGHADVASPATPSSGDGGPSSLGGAEPKVAEAFHSAVQEALAIIEPRDLENKGMEVFSQLRRAVLHAAHAQEVLDHEAEHAEAVYSFLLDFGSRNRKSCGRVAEVLTGLRKGSPVWEAAYAQERVAQRLMQLPKDIQQLLTGEEGSKGATREHHVEPACEEEGRRPVPGEEEHAPSPVSEEEPWIVLPLDTGEPQPVDASESQSARDAHGSAQDESGSKAALGEFLSGPNDAGVVLGPSPCEEPPPLQEPLPSPERPPLQELPSPHGRLPESEELPSSPNGPTCEEPKASQSWSPASEELSPTQGRLPQHEELSPSPCRLPKSQELFPSQGRLPTGEEPPTSPPSLEEEPSPSEGRLPCVERGSALPAYGGSYTWLMRSNTYEDRGLRWAAASVTEEVCRHQGYRLQGRNIRLQHLAEMRAGTCCIRGGMWIQEATNAEETAWFRHPPGQLVPVAVERTIAGKTVALVNAASAYHVGGGFLSGGRHALEESLCMQSTLFESLKVAQDTAEAAGVLPPGNVVPRTPRRGKRWHCHIPYDGVVLSPKVEVFRGGTLEGYPFFEAPVTVEAIVNVAMPNCNPQVSDAPVDAPSDQDWYSQLLAVKFAAVCKAALSVGAEVLVIPDAGCGVYGNSAFDVGRAFGEVVLQHFPHAFAEVHLVGSSAFAEAAEAAAAAAAGGGGAQGSGGAGASDELASQCNLSNFIAPLEPLAPGRIPAPSAPPGDIGPEPSIPAPCDASQQAFATPSASRAPSGALSPLAEGESLPPVGTVPTEGPASGAAPGDPLPPTETVPTASGQQDAGEVSATSVPSSDQTPPAGTIPTPIAPPCKESPGREDSAAAPAATAPPGGAAVPAETAPTLLASTRQDLPGQEGSAAVPAAPAPPGGAALRLEAAPTPSSSTRRDLPGGPPHVGPSLQSGKTPPASAAPCQGDPGKAPAATAPPGGATAPAAVVPTASSTPCKDSPDSPDLSTIPAPAAESSVDPPEPGGPATPGHPLHLASAAPTEAGSADKVASVVQATNKAPAANGDVQEVVPPPPPDAGLPVKTLWRQT